MNGTATVEQDVLSKKIEQDLAPYKQEVAVLEEQAKSLIVTDDLSEAVALEFINGAKRLYGEMDGLRDERVRPLNSDVKKIND